jgi:hypothetical protein
MQLAGLKPYPADYNPPALLLMLNATNKAFENATVAYNVAFQQALNNITQVVGGASSFNISSIEALSGSPEGTQSSSFAVKYATFGGSFAFGNVFSLFGTVVWFFLLIDYIFRFYRTAQAGLSYTGKGAVVLPVVDMSRGETITGSSFRTVPIRTRMIACVTSPFTIGALVAFVALMIVLLLSLAYKPLFEAYQSGCVFSSDGTTLSNNTNSLVSFLVLRAQSCKSVKIVTCDNITNALIA